MLGIPLYRYEGILWQRAALVLSTIIRYSGQTCRMSQLSPDQASTISIDTKQIVLAGTRLSFTVEIGNGSDRALSSEGSYPVRLAWFIVDQDDPGPWTGEFERVSLAAPVAAGSSAFQVVDIPIAACDVGRSLVVTLVAEDAFWFHLLPDPRFAQVEIPAEEPWWGRREARNIAFSTVETLNRKRFKPIFGQNGGGRPLFLHLETVNICNLKCLICPYAKMQRTKETMSSELFDDIIHDYIEMGGGDVGLTPSVGDIFLDKKLVERVRTLRHYPEIKSLGFVTNAGNAGVVSDQDLSYVINECARINISVYGLDEEENAAMTRRPGKFGEIQRQIRRMVDLNERAVLVFAFRLLKPDAEERARQWLLSTLGQIYPHEVLTTYGNWGGAIDVEESLPFQGNWATPTISQETDRKPCAYPALHLKVAVNGDVKFCSCIDYDSLPENIIGNVKSQRLSDIYNGYRAKSLWSKGLSICSGCTHYKPIDLFVEHFEKLSSPIKGLGI